MPDIFDQAASDKSQPVQLDIFDQAAAATDGPWNDYAAAVRPLKGLTDLPSTPDFDYATRPDPRVAAVFASKPAYNPADQAQGNSGAKSMAVAPVDANGRPLDAPQTTDERVRQTYAPKKAFLQAGNTPALSPHPSSDYVQPYVQPTGYEGYDTGLKPVADAAVQAAKEVGTGVKELGPSDAEMRAGAGAYERGIGATPLTPEEQAATNRQAMGGAAKIIAGGGTLAAAIDAPELLNMTGAAAAGDTASIIALGKIGAGVGAGYGASRAAGALADRYNLTPEAKDLLVTSAFFFPALGARIAAASGIEGDIVATRRGTVAAGVRVGKNAAAVEFGRPAEAAPPSATQATANNLLDQGLETMKQAQAAQAAAEAIVNGATPEQAVAAQQPKAPPTPADQAAAQMFPTPVIQQEHMTAAAAIIKSLPPEAQGAATLQAHDQISAQIAKWTTFVGPDGKTYTVNSPKDANKYASQFINAEVDKHDANVAQQQKDAQAAQQAAEKPAVAPAGKSKLQQAKADKQEATAKTIIESNSDLPRARLIDLLSKQLQLNPGDAARVLTDYQTKAAAAALPTVGSKDQPVVEESRKTVDAQIEALTRGDIKVVMLPEGSSYKPALPPGMKVVNVKGDAPGAGTYIYDPTKITPRTITEAAKADTHHALLGHIQSKAEIAKAGLPTAVVQASKPDGTPIQDSEVNSPQVAKQQAEILQQRHPDAVVSLKPTEQVIQERIAAQKEDSGLGFKEAFGSAKDAISNSFARDAFEKKGKLPFRDKPGTLENKIYTAFKEGKVANVDDVKAIMAEHFNPPKGAEPKSQPAKPLPAELAKSKPRYGFQGKNFDLDFADPRDLAAYVTSQKTPNKRHDDFAEYLKAESPGKKDSEIKQHQALVRDYIKNAAKSGDPADGPIKVPSMVEVDATKRNLLKAIGASDEQLASKGDIFDQAAGEQVAPPSQAKGEPAENKPEQKGADHIGLAAAPSEPTHTYTAQVRRYAGDPNPKTVEVKAVNRRHAESLLAEQHPKMHVSDIERLLGKQVHASEPARKYYGSTQHNLDKNSEASKAVDAVRARVEAKDLAGDGKNIDGNHVTVRYGIQGGETKGIREYLSKLAPFEAKLGATDSFPPTKNSDGAAVVNAPVESPELHRINAEIAKHGDFKESDFPEYKPHVTVAYVKPEAVGKYVGLKDTEGKRFTVNSIAISDRDGNHEEIKLQGKPPAKATPQIPGLTPKYVLPTFATNGARTVPVEDARDQSDSMRAPFRAEKQEDGSYIVKDANNVGWAQLSGDDVEARVNQKVDEWNKRYAPPDIFDQAEKLPKKDDVVTFKSLAGKKLKGTVKFSEGAVTRIKGEDGKTYNVPTKNVEVPAAPEKELATPVAKEDTTNDADTGTKRETEGDAEAGGGRAPADLGSEDRNAVDAGEAGLLPPAPEGRDAEEGSPRDGNLVPRNDEPGRSQRVEPGSGEGISAGIDQSPALGTIKATTKALAKPVVLNKAWFAHPDNWQPPSTTMQRLETNLAALKILRDIDKNPRLPTDEEKETLANYVGWGSLPHIFDPYRAPMTEQRRWQAANQELRKYLNDEEFKTARLSTINAHYTSPDLVRFMWDAMQRFGFKSGNLLEPSMGSGNFFGMIPKSVRGKVSAIGNELEPVTYSIAKLLYPDALIHNKDFVELILPDNGLDLAIGNVPFGDAIYDPKYPKLKANLHDYFFVKALDKVKPGGIVSFITSTGTMDRQSSTIRDLLASKADLVGAFRLPSNAFKANAGTDVTTDLIILQKRAADHPVRGESWKSSTPLEMDALNGGRESLHVNEYFQRHPENMLGKLIASKAMYGSYRPTLVQREDTTLKAELAKALQKLPKGIMLDDNRQASGQAPTPAVYAPDNIQENQYVVKDGKLLQRKNGTLVSPAIVEGKDGTKSVAKMARLKDMVALRDKFNSLLMDMNTLPDDEQGNAIVAKGRTALKKQYEGFVQKNGLLNSVANNIFNEDPHYPRLLSLENYDRATKSASPALVFEKRTVFPQQPLKSVSADPKEALQQILSERGFPDLHLMAELQNKPVSQVSAALSKAGLIYRDPVTGAYETREKYLSGYVRDKLDDARRAVEQGMKEYEPNVAALEKAVPPDVKMGHDPKTSIAVRLGATWVPIPAIQSFFRDVFKTPAIVTYDKGEWKVEGYRPTAELNNVFGTPFIDAADLTQMALNQKMPTIRDKEGKIRPAETAGAQAAQEKIRQEFQKWAVDSAEWSPKLEKAYNYAYNNLASAEYDGSHLTFPGMITELNGKPFSLKAHQVNAIWRILQDGRALLAHEVGAGKTFEMAAAIMESKRLGIAKKPMLTVPNHIVEQFRQEFLTLYPGANLLVPTEADFDSKNRQRIMSQIATGDYDCIILPHSQFNLLDISPERQRVTIEKQMDELQEALDAATKAEGKKSRTVKQLEKAKEKLKTQLKKLSDLKADKAIYFDHTGVDALYVDEAHAYKNLNFYTKMTRIAGLGQSNSKSALRLKMKTEYLQERNAGRGVIFATGTPIQNTMAELPTMIKYIAPDVLEKAGIRYFDDWAANFGSTISAMELAPDGRSYKVRTKFARFQNVPELMQMYRSFADIKTADDLDLDTPEIEGGKGSLITVPASDEVSEYIEGLMKRAEALKGGQVDPKVDNMLKITSEGRKAATDMRLLDPNAEDHEGSKINMAVRTIYQDWLEGKEQKLTQMAFLDMYRYVDEDGVERLNLYNDMRDKLVRAGVPRNEIAVIGEHDTRIKRQKLFSQMNSGEVRILFGSTHKMGAGTNAQRRLKSLHHIDLPWRPGDIAQRNGRAVRQGNINEEVRLNTFLTSKSFDAYMAQALQSKATFIAQTMGNKTNERTMTDAAAEMVMGYEEMKVAASGNPDVRLKYDLEMKQATLYQLWASHDQQLRSNKRALGTEEMRVSKFKGDVNTLEANIAEYKKARGEKGEGFSLQVPGASFADRKEAFKALAEMPIPAGNFNMTMNGVSIQVQTRGDDGSLFPTLQYRVPWSGLPESTAKMSMESLGLSIENRLRHMENVLEDRRNALKAAETAEASLRKLVGKEGEFPQKDELEAIQKQLKEVEKRLGLGDVNAGSQANSEAVAADAADETEDDEPDTDDDEPEDLTETKKDDKPAPSAGGGPTLRSSLFGVDLAGEAAMKAARLAWEKLGKPLWDKDVAPALASSGKTMKDIGMVAMHMMVPTFGANRDVLDSFMRLKGDQEKKRFQMEQVFKGIEKMFDKMPEADRIAFLDRYKTGKPQPSPELQKVADMYHDVDDRNYRLIVNAQIGVMDKSYRKLWDRMSAAEQDKFFDELTNGKNFALKGDDKLAEDGDKDAMMRIAKQEIADGVLTFKENHLRSFWKVIPGSGGKERSNFGGKSPLRGDRGFTKKSTLPDVSTGIADGGVLETTNPQKLIEMNQASVMRYVTALNMFKEAGDLGRRKFVKLGDKPPDGWTKVDDAMFKVFRPVTTLKDDPSKLPDSINTADLRTSRAMIESGAWHMPESDARLLNNYLSKDWFKSNAIGKGLLAVKNISTAIELALAPFHLVFEGLESMGSQFGLGLMQAMNVGIGHGDLKSFLEGLKTMATSPAAPVTTARLGGSAIKAVGNYAEFAATKRGREFLKAFPNAGPLIDLYFTGGGTIGQPKDFQIKLMEGARAAYNDGNYVGALFRAVPALSKTAMSPLFETYIPRLKVGFALQMMSQQIVERSDDLASGKTTLAEIAREVVNTTENRFGELNFSNLWWNNTFKSAMQLMFRSVTWKLGNWRGAGAGVVGQAKAFADPLKTMYADAKGERKGADRKARDYIAKLDMNMSWLIGMAVTTAVLSTIMTKLLTDRYPWEYIDEDRGEGKGTAESLALEMMHPRTNGADSYTEKPTRLSLPTGLRDFEHAYEDPRNYLHGSESGFVSKTLDSWDNRDFFGNYIYDPNGTMYQKFASLLAYNVPQPIPVQTFRAGLKSGDMSRFEHGLLGLSNAPKSLDLTPLEKNLEAIAKAKHIPRTPEEQDEYRAKQQAIKDGTLTGPEKKRALTEMRKPYLVRMFDKLSYQEARNAFLNEASPEEQEILKPELAKKLYNAMRRNPSTTRAEENGDN